MTLHLDYQTWGWSLEIIESLENGYTEPVIVIRENNWSNCSRTDIHPGGAVAFTTIKQLTQGRVRRATEDAKS